MPTNHSLALTPTNKY